MVNQRGALFIISAFLVSNGAWSANTWAALTPTAATLRSELSKRGGSSFEPLLKKWQQSYGTQAVDPLLKLATRSSSSKLSDSDRYVALMGAAKLGGPAIAPRLTGFLKDPSWMVRSATLKALSALQHPSTASAVLPLLRDPALVVRLEAVNAVQILQPVGARKALEAAIKDPLNYHGGKPLWVPQKAQAALKAISAK